VAERPSITCPTCQLTSHHPEDVRFGWCGYCHGYTSPPFGCPTDDAPLGVKGMPHRYCHRCRTHVPTLTWRGDDHAVVVTGNLVFDEPMHVGDQVSLQVWAPSALTWCSRVDWEATRGS
jgi:hypothetical protein